MPLQSPADWQLGFWTFSWTGTSPGELLKTTMPGIIPQNSDSLGLRLVLDLWFWKLSRWFRGAAWRGSVEVWGSLALPAEGPLLFSPGVPQLPMSSRTRGDGCVAGVTGPLWALSKNDLCPWVSFSGNTLGLQGAPALLRRHLLMQNGLAGLLGFFFNFLPPSPWQLVFNFLSHPPYQLRVGCWEGVPGRPGTPSAPWAQSLETKRRNSHWEERECSKGPAPPSFPFLAVVRPRALLECWTVLWVRLRFAMDISYNPNGVSWCWWLCELAYFINLIPGNSLQTLVSLVEWKHGPVLVVSTNCLLCSCVESMASLRDTS